MKQLGGGPLIGDQEIKISIDNNSPFLLYFLLNIYKFIQYLAKQKDVLKEIEKNAIVDALIFTEWNMSKASKVLGVSRMTLYRKIETYGIEENE